MARVNRQLIAILDRARGFVDVREVQSRMNSLSVEVECKRNDVDIPRTLAIAEQRSFNAFGPGHHREFCVRHAGSTVVVRMRVDDDAIALGNVSTKPLDLIGIYVRRRDLYGGR